MDARDSLRKTLPALIVAAGFMLPGYAAGQIHPHADQDSMATTIQIPESMRVEHAELHSALEEATRAEGAVGEAAREVARVLDPHFRREEEIALPPLGLLEHLAAGRVTPDMRHVLPLTDALEAELPRMLEEHGRIRRALEGLADAARAAGQPRYADLAERVIHHAQMEEQVTYPTAILVGRYVRMRLEHEP